MANSDKLWFEMGVRDDVSKTISEIMQKAEELQDVMGAITFGKEAIKNANDFEQALDKIAVARRRISEARFVATNKDDIDALKRMDKEVTKIQKRFERIISMPDETIKAMMGTGGMAKYQEMLTGLPLALDQIRRRTSEVTAQAVADERAKEAEARRVDDLKSKYYELYDIRKKLQDAIMQAAPGVDITAAVSMLNSVTARMGAIRNAQNNGRGLPSSVVGADAEDFFRRTREQTRQLTSATDDYNRRLSTTEAIQANIHKLVLDTESQQRISQIRKQTTEYVALGQKLREIEDLERRIDAEKRGIQSGSISKPAYTRDVINAELDAIQRRYNEAMARGRQLEKEDAEAKKQKAAASEKAAQSIQLLANVNQSLISSYSRVAEAGQRANHVTLQLQQQVGQFASFYGIKRIVNSVITIGGQFEYQHVALQNILGDVREANTLFSQLQTLAIESPKTFMELTNYTKQLSAYQIPYEELYDTTKRLADLSSGLGVDMSRLILAYGQVRSAAVLRGQELRQFTEAGIPLVQKLADEFSALNGKAVTTGDVFELISKRAVSFEMVKKILWDMTNEGGQFFNMQGELADTLYGKWQKLQDQWEITLGHIAEGESLSGRFLKGTLNLLVKIAATFDTMLPIIGTYALGRSVRKIGRSANSVLERSSGQSAINNMQLTKMREANRLERERLMYGRQLNAAELELVNTKTKLTANELRLLLIEGEITEKQLWQLRNSKSLVRLEVLKALRAQGYTIEQLKQIKNGNIQILQGSSRLKQGLQGAWNFVGGWLGVASAALGGLLSLYGSAQEKAEKAREAAKASNDAMMKDLSNVNTLYGDLTKKSPEGVEDTINAVQRMTSALKDSGNYTTELEEKISAAGEDSTAKYKILYEQLKKVSDEFLRMKYNLEGYFEVANRVGEGGNWFTRLFNDNMAEDLKNLSESTITKNIKAGKLDKKEIQGLLKKRLEEYLKDEGLWSDAYRSMDFSKIFEKLEEKTRNSFKNSVARKASEMFMGEGERKFWEDAEEALTSYAKSLSEMEADRKEVMKQMPEYVDNVIYGLQKRGELSNIDIMDVSKWSDGDERKVSDWINELVSKYELDPETSDLLKEKIIKGLPAEVQAKILAIPVIKTDDLSPWQQELDGYFKKMKLFIPIDAKTSLEQVEKELQNKHKEFQEQMDRSGQVLISLGLDLSKLPKTFDEIRDQIPFLKWNWAEKNFLEYSEGKAGSEKTTEAGKDLGIPVVKPKKSGSSGGSKEDKVLKQWKERKKALDEYYKLYEEYSKYMSEEEAIKKINDTGLINGQNLPKNISDYLSVLKEFMNGIRGQISGTERQSFWDSLVGDVNKKDFEENTKEAVDALLKKLEEELKKQGKQWDLYKKIVEATGSKEQAAKIAFGGSVRFDNFAEELRARIEKELAGKPQAALGIDKLLGMDEKELEKAGIHAKSEIIPMLKELKEAEQQVKSEEVEKMLNAMKKMAGVEEQITAAENKLAEARQKYGENSVQALALEKELAELRIKQLEESEQYLRFYSGIMGMTIQEAETAGTAIKENLVKQLASGAINADKYLKSMKNVNVQLEKIRSKKGLLGQFASGGVSGVLSARGEVVDANAANAAIRLQKAEEELDRAREELGKITENSTVEERMAATARKANAEAALQQAQIDNKKAEKAQQLLGLDKQQVQSINETIAVVEMFIGAMDGVAKAFQQISEMFEALGQEGRAAGWSDAADTLSAITSPLKSATGAVKSALSGDIGGAISGVVGVVTSPITAFAKLHDKKRERSIQKSQMEVKKLTNEYQRLQEAMEESLGGIYTSGGYDEALANLMAQRDELQRQMDLERDKKDSDAGKIEDYKQQIAEMEDSIKNFALDMAKALYDIDIQSWASELTDAVVSAWENGENAVDAYKGKVKEMMKDLTKNILAKKVMEKALENIGLDKLIADLVAGTQGQLDEGSVKSISEKLLEAGENASNVITSVLDAMESQGVIDRGESSGSSASTVGKTITEEHAGMLIALVETMRADLSVNRQTLFNIMEAVKAQAQMPVIAEAQLRQLEAIAANTGKNAGLVQEIRNMLSSNLNGGPKFRVQ